MNRSETPRAARAGGAPSAPARWSRGVLVGLVGGLGAAVAHRVSGGEVTPVVGLVVTTLSVALALGLARWRVGLLPAVALATAGQATCHLLMAGGAGHHHATGGPSSGASMVLAHVSVVAVTAALCRGADQVVLDLVRTLVSWFRPRTHLLRQPPAVRRARHLLDALLLPSPVRVASTPRTRRGPPSAAHDLVIS